MVERDTPRPPSEPCSFSSGEDDFVQVCWDDENKRTDAPTTAAERVAPSFAITDSVTAHSELYECDAWDGLRAIVSEEVTSEMETFIRDTHDNLACECTRAMATALCKAILDPRDSRHINLYAFLHAARSFRYRFASDADAPVLHRFNESEWTHRNASRELRTRLRTWMHVMYKRLSHDWSSQNDGGRLLRKIKKRVTKRVTQNNNHRWSLVEMNKALLHDSKSVMKRIYRGMYDLEEALSNDACFENMIAAVERRIEREATETFELGIAGADHEDVRASQ
ncbi:hypothetical protein CYMTET_35638 [Cymbomonas tetramitiformis]|uniref:Uncharacterized protein n=1 Tax=Cymbomonas tetramitiformis TaxID=36881 RepID=A0AAE0F8V5_9CHLO|nr:hypothetical protein CYMTET_35638 [Cymbomonas tetramitiformis]